MKLRKITAFAMTIVMTGLCCVNAFAVNLKVDGTTANLTHSPQNAENYWLVEGGELAALLGLKSVWSPDRKTLTIADGTAKTAVFTAGRKSYEVNNIAKTMPLAAIETINGLYVPVRVVCETFEAKILWDGIAQNILITTPLKNADAIVARYSDDGAKGATKYEDALKRALEINSDIKNLSDNIEYMQKQRTELVDMQPTDVYVTAETRQISDTNFSAWLRQINALESEISNKEYNERLTKGMSEYLMRNAIIQIKLNEIDISVLSENVSLAENNLKNVTLKNSVGMASDADVKTARTNVDKLKTSLSALQLTARDNKLALNKLLDYPADTNLIIPLTPAYSELPKSINDYIRIKTSEDPQIKKLEATLENAEYALNVTWDTVTDYELEKIKNQNAVNQAARNLSDAKTNLSKNIESAYNDLNKLLENQNGLTVDLAKAHEDLSNATASYQAGFSTVYEVNGAKLSVLRAETEIAKNIYNYSNLYFAFQNPYLLQ